MKKLKNQVWKTQNWCNQKDNGFECSISAYYNSTNTEPINMFFTKKCNYFSQATRSLISKKNLLLATEILRQVVALGWLIRSTMLDINNNY